VPLDAMLTKARHAIPMGSQSKVNSEEEFRTWMGMNVQVDDIMVIGFRPLSA